MEASGSAEETLDSSLPASFRQSEKWPTSNNYVNNYEESLPSSGPASLGPANSEGSPALEYDLWEGQFEFLGPNEQQQSACRKIFGRMVNSEQVLPVQQQVQMIQEQMHVLADTQSAGEERYARVKQENATLQARILMLEEAAKDAEARAEDKLEAEQRRHREYASRLEREKELQLENCAIKLQAAELETSRVRDEATRLREQLEKLREEKLVLESALEEAQIEAERAREDEKRCAHNLAETNRVLKQTEEELAQRLDAERRLEEIEREMSTLRARNKALEESRDELQAAAVALQAGRALLMPSGQDPNDNTINRKNSPSLATELLLTGSTHDEADGETGRPCTADICDNITNLPDAKRALKEQIEVNTRLRAYLDNILLNIVENHPQLLEVKQPH